MLLLNETNNVTFNVNVHGTSSTPTVRCVIGDVPGLSYPAIKLVDGKYKVAIDLPESFTPGSYPFKVEVMLNGRLFTPISTQISVEGSSKPQVTDVPKTSIIASIAEVAPAEVAPAEVAPALKAQKFAETVPTPKKKKGLSALESLVKKPVEKLKPRKGQTDITEHKQKISIAAIANEAAKSDTYTQTVQPKTVIEHSTSIPISLVKGEIIYR